MTNPPADLLQHLFHKAMELPPAARAAFVANKCRGDQALERELAAKLAAAGDAAFRRADPPVPPTTDATTPPDARPATAVLREVPGNVIGPYRLLQQIGEGGFGVVFLAEQSEPVQRQVALKIVKLGMDTEQVVARFEQERQALAVMDHPHIAKVFDAGSTATGRPYFVMELCRGEPLTDYCDKNQLTIVERLVLFEQICHAVQHAHGKGIIHRDLKPSNVLVGSLDGAPHAKVIDFGIAKATAQRLTERTLFTAAQQVVGTLQYMSPEQAEGSLDIDTRTDVYSLGVILYELLTGSTPFDRRTLQDAALSEVHRLIREVEPHKPSTRLADSRATRPAIARQRRVDEHRLTALVRGELDWIVMRSIEKDRTRRYATANALAEDVARFRRSEPVEAAPPSARYRVRKFVGRHRGPVLAAALVLVALLAGIAGTAWGLVEAKHQERRAGERADAESKQRQRADAERDRAVRWRNQALDALRATTGEDVEKLLGSHTELTRRERDYLEAIAQRWLTFSNQAGADVTSRELRAEGLERVAALRQRFERHLEAKSDYEQSLALWDGLHEELPDEPRYERLQTIVHLELARVLADLDDAAAAGHYRAANEVAERLTARFPDVADYRFYQAQAHDGLGRHLRARGQRDAARTELLRASDLQQALVAELPRNAHWQQGLVSTRSEMALLLTEVGDRDGARVEYEALCDLHRDLLAQDPDDATLRLNLANSLQNLATVLTDLGRCDDAVRDFRAAIQELERLVADQPGVPGNQRVLARTRQKLGSLLCDLGQNDAAKTELTAARQQQSQLVATFPAMPSYRGELASTEHDFALLLLQLGDRKGARELFEVARAEQLQLVAEHASVPTYALALADTQTQLGILLAASGQKADAEAAFVAGRDVAQRLATADPDSADAMATLANLRNGLGILWRDQGRADALAELEAARNLRQTLATRFPQVPRHRTLLGGSHCNIGNTLLAMDPAASLASFDAAVNVLQPVVAQLPGDDTARQFLRNSHMGRARAAVALGRWSAAVADWERCLEIARANERGFFREQRKRAMLHGGDVVGALAEADTNAAAADAGPRVRAARVYALAAEDAGRRQECGDRAMALLRQAVESGWREASALAADEDFGAVRDREDFRLLVGGK